MQSLSFDSTSSDDLEEGACWQAVLKRDESAEYRFVYAVYSTRIFCRPTCPSRRPRRDNVCFFLSPDAALKAGFRACKRCRPETSLSPVLERVEQACRLIEANSEKPLSLSELSRRIGSSPHHFQRTFKQIMGISPRQYSDAVRLSQLKTRLQNGETLLNARCDAGYGSTRSLYQRAPQQLGMTPATYQRGGRGAQIGFSIVPCSLGFLLVAATPTGVCAVALGDEESALEAALRAEFPEAQIESDETRLQLWVAAVLEFLSGQQPHLDLPLDVRATSFQWRVWQILRSIGAGETRSYAQVAQMMGHPQAARAVARACATNPVALLIPCHRVVRGDGKLSGYRWGLERKRALLDGERSGL